MWTDDDERKERLVLELVVAEGKTSSADYVGREHVADQHGWLALVTGFHQRMVGRRKQARAGGGALRHITVGSSAIVRIDQGPDDLRGGPCFAA